MIVELHLEDGRRRAWMLTLLRSLQADGFTPQIRWRQTLPPPAGLEGLLALERSLLRSSKPGGADSVALEAFEPFVATAQPGITIDFTTSPARPDKSDTRRLQVFFNGESGENALLAAVLSGHLPQIEICDVRSGVILERGTPSSETADGLGGALDAVMTRVTTLLRATLSGRPRLTPPPTVSTPQRPCRTPAAYVAANLSVGIIKAIYHLCCHAPHWQVGWRYTHKGVAERQSLAGHRWNVLPGAINSVFADPFAVTWRGRQFVFAEELNGSLGRGIISAVEFDDNGPKGRMAPVLVEPWHLSYPFMIEHQGELWMIPESSGNRDVAIYRAARFPDRWERHATLLSGVDAADATIVKHNGRFYMFAVTREDGGGYSDTLSIFHAPDLFGPWEPHAANPIVMDRALARPAGNFFFQGGELWRPLQDCTDGYGAALALARITELTPERFHQDVRTILRPGDAWPGRKIHTLNRSGNLEVIDGTSVWPKWKLPSIQRQPRIQPPLTQPSQVS